MPLPIPADEYARQCVNAAHSSRLNPFTLHAGEYQILKTRITTAQTGIYLLIRNGILRLWTRNPLVSVSQEEAVGCAKESRYHCLALLAHEWLTRHGYINFGCVEVADLPFKGPGSGARQQTIIVVGAGVSGLACARQLQSLFKQFPERWTKLRKERLPRVIVLEGRDRIGGRVYSHPLRCQVKHSLQHQLANTAETGAQIVTGFDHGNPLDAIIRGQLALEYHSLKDNMLLYDFDGSLIQEKNDELIQALWDDILEEAGQHSWQPQTEADVNTGLPQFGKDFKNQDGIFSKLSQCNGAALKGPTEAPKRITLGSFMDNYIKRYRTNHTLSSQQMRLLNWHYANLEYASAVNVDQLSLGGWDQDSGNEFDGRHSQIIGGYSQVVRGLWKYPQPLDVRLHKDVGSITTHTDPQSGTQSTRIGCSDGDVFVADYVVSTLPLGVLQHEQQLFTPPLPLWKQSAMQRLGFGLLNKIILVFEHVFWEETRDMFGLLNKPPNEHSLSQRDYVSERGKCYLFWNCVKTSGRPMLVALMAGDAARQAEEISEDVLVEDVTQRLARMFSLDARPVPKEVIITKWRKDIFARGSYSYLGPAAQPGDYDAMAKPVGDLFFAGEATCGTHPATVHGAYLSGLRAAAEVCEAMIGPVPVPLDLEA